MKFEKSLEEKVRELETYIGKAYFVLPEINTMFNSIYASIEEWEKSVDAFIDVEVENMQSLSNDRKLLKKS